MKSTAAIIAAAIFAAASAIFAAASAIFAAASAISFDEGYTPLFGVRNIVRSADGRTVQIVLNEYSGSGFVSLAPYYHGFFSASIKLPSDYTAGVVVAFYLSNGDIFKKNHDELDLEFLGNIKGKQWRIQTNVYGNGSINRGREERYYLPFDPTLEAHRYSILWTNSTIIFYIDEIPIREIVRTASMGAEFPSKPMSLYATIWDASNWATSGGKYKVDYNHSPFITEFSNFILKATAAEDCTLPGEMTAAKRVSMREFRMRYMSYGFCHDEIRYPKAFPECDGAVSESEKVGFFNNGYAKVSHAGRRRRWRRRRDRSRSGFRGGYED